MNEISKISLIVLFIGNCLFAQILKKETQSFQISNTEIFEYTKPKIFDMVKYVPLDVYGFGKFTIQKKNMVWTGAALGSTLILLPFDQKLIDNAHEIGTPLNLSEDVRYKRILGIEFLPKDINGAIYYLGNGLIPILLSGGFYISGQITGDYRSLNVSSELIEVLLSAGLTTQVIKRITGRQSPSASMEDGNNGGHWTPFPSFSAFQTNTPNYDAMPSGHLATFMATITVLSTNYPEIKWIKPVGYSLTGLLAFQMMSSRVHWASDYPFAILMGYVIGKNAANRRINKERKRDLTGEIIIPKFKTDFTFGYTSEYKIVGLVVSF
uniref:phosphatase PAP2 family protein n=1 Tax=Mariniflexile sp. TaxID=1979402 RepID=UPI004047EDB5